MLVHITEITWRYIYETLSSHSSPPIHLKLLDTVIFDQLHPYKPQIWVFTNLGGYMESRNIRNLTIDDILQAFLENILIGENAYNIHVDKEPRASLILADHSRVLADTLTLWKVVQLYPGGVSGIQLFKVPGVEFENYYYFHEINSSNSPNETFTRVSLEVYDSEENVENDIIVNNMKKASNGIISRVLERTRLGLNMIKLVYFVDIDGLEVWLVGVEKCLLCGDSRILQNRNKQSLVSIQPQSFVLQASCGDDSPGHIRSKSMPKMLQIKKNAMKDAKRANKNSTPSKDRFPSIHVSLPRFLGTQFNSISRSPEMTTKANPYSDSDKPLTASYKGLPYPKKFNNGTRPISSKLEVLSLPPNNNAFLRAMAEMNPPKRRKEISPAKSSRSEVPKSTLIKPYRKLYGTKCYGNYCYEPQIRLLRYDLSERFIIPESLIKLASLDDYNPSLHKQLFRIPKEVTNTIQYYNEGTDTKARERLNFTSREDITSSLINSRLILKDQDAYLPVCYRCLVVYFNIESRMKSVT